MKRVKTMGIGIFFRNRFIRLHPLVIIGSVLGLLEYIFTPFANNVAQAGWGNIVLAFICSLFLIPYSVLPNRADCTFALNTPSWSLSTEYLANIFYALVLCRISKKILLLLFIASVTWIFYVAKTRGWLIMGWEKNYYFDGWARTAFSFMLGLIIFRFRLIIKTRINVLVLLLLLISVFMFPHFEKDGLMELALVGLAFPLILSLAAGATVSGWLKNFCMFIGRLSYPVYMTHIFVVWSFGNYYNQYKPVGIKLWGLVIMLIAGILALGYLIMRFYDEPIRRYLVKTWVKREDSKKRVSAISKGLATN